MQKNKLKRVLKSKKGGMIVEAAIAFPIVIIVIIAGFSFVITRYVETTRIVNEHITVLKFSDEKSKVGELNLKRKKIMDKYSSEIFSKNEKVKKISKGIFGIDYGKTKQTRSYIISETKEKRNDLL